MQLWQESCSNSLLDLATPITKGLAQYQREGGAQHPPPRTVPKGSGRGTETSQHIYSAPSISEARFKGLFAVRGGCTRTGKEQREAPAPPALCLSAKEFTCRENLLPPQRRQLHMDSDGESDAAPPSSGRIMSRRMQSHYPFSPLATRTSPLQCTPTPLTYQQPNNCNQQ